MSLTSLIRHKKIRKFKFSAYSVVLLLLSSQSALAKVPLFSEFSIELPFNLTQPVIAADLFPKAGNELVIVGVSEDGKRHLAVYGFEASLNHWILLDQMTLSHTLFAYDIGVPNIDGLQKLYFLSKNAIFEYQYEPQKLEREQVNFSSAEDIDQLQKTAISASQLKRLVDIDSMYLSERADSISTLDFSQDINEDKQDDFVLAQFEHLDLWLNQAEKSAFLHQSLAIAPLLEVDGQTVTFTPHKLFFNDMNLDNKSDIILVDKGQLQVYKQIKDGSFATQSIAIKLASDIEGINWWDKTAEDGQQLDQSELQHKMVEAISDVNGDGIADLIVRFTQSSGVLDRSNDYEFYYGRVEQQQLHFASAPDTRITSESTLSDLKLVDLDNDGRQEVMVSAFDLGVSQIISALLSSSIEQEMFIYQMNDKGQFPSKPTVSQDVEITFSLSSGRSGEPMVKVQDIDGDGMKDLLFSEEDEEISVTLASSDTKRLFNRRSQSYDVQVPKNAKSITHNDLNLDNKMDLILHYSRADAAEKLNKVIVLIAN